MKKSILITGSSTGFGKLTAQTLAKDGHKVFATMRGVNGKNKEHATVLSDWAKENDLDLTILELDVTSDHSVKAATDTILKQTGGGIDVIVNNAGIYGSGVLESFTIEDYKNIFEVNVFGSARVINAFLPTLRKQKSGLIIQVGSVVGRVVLPFQGVYIASKFAIEALTETLHYELAPLGIEAVLVQPGPFPTEIFEKFYTTGNSLVINEYGVSAEFAKGFGETFGSIMAGDVPNKPQHVADAIKTLVDTPVGQKPLRTTVDLMMNGITQAINDHASNIQAGLLSEFGLGDLLKVKA